MNRRDYSAEWPAISRAIIRRAKNACELCPAENGKTHWKTASLVVLTVHHIDGDKTNNNPMNLLALCQRCHLRLDAPYREKKRRGGQRELGL